MPAFRWPRAFLPQEMWDELDLWHSKLNELDAEVHDIVEQDPGQAQEWMDRLMVPFQQYQQVSQRAEARTSQLNKVRRVRAGCTEQAVVWDGCKTKRKSASLTATRQVQVGTRGTGFAAGTGGTSNWAGRGSIQKLDPSISGGYRRSQQQEKTSFRTEPFSFSSKQGCG